MSENKSKFNIKYINTNIGHVYYRLAEFFSVTPQTLLTTENLCFKQKSNFSGKVLPHPYCPLSSVVQCPVDSY